MIAPRCIFPKTALRSSASFAEAVYAPNLGDATSVAVTIMRRDLRDEVPKDEVIAVSPPLQFGEPRVGMSGGSGFNLSGANYSSFALSGGLVFSNRNDWLVTEFIAGPSLSFANNKFF